MVVDDACKVIPLLLHHPDSETGTYLDIQTLRRPSRTLPSASAVAYSAAGRRTSKVEETTSFHFRRNCPHMIHSPTGTGGGT